MYKVCIVPSKQRTIYIIYMNVQLVPLDAEWLYAKGSTFLPVLNDTMQFATHFMFPTELLYHAVQQSFKQSLHSVDLTGFCLAIPRYTYSQCTCILGHAFRKHTKHACTRNHTSHARMCVPTTGTPINIKIVVVVNLFHRPKAMQHDSIMQPTMHIRSKLETSFLCVHLFVNSYLSIPQYDFTLAEW